MTIVLTVLLAVLKFVGWLLLFLLALLVVLLILPVELPVCLSGWQTIAVPPGTARCILRFGHGPLPKIRLHSIPPRRNQRPQHNQALNQRCLKHSLHQPQPLLRNPRKLPLRQRPLLRQPPLLNLPESIQNPALCRSIFRSVSRPPSTCSLMILPPLSAVCSGTCAGSGGSWHGTSKCSTLPVLRTVTGEDAAQTAELYGAAMAAANNLLAFLQQVVCLQYATICSWSRISPANAGESVTFPADCTPTRFCFSGCYLAFVPSGQRPAATACTYQLNQIAFCFYKRRSFPWQSIRSRSDGRHH